MEAATLSFKQSQRPEKEFSEWLILDTDKNMQFSQLSFDCHLYNNQYLQNITV